MTLFSKPHRLRRGWSLLSLWPRVRVYGRAIFDARTPRWGRFAALAAFIYVLSPIDFVPDFIPFAGWLDDFVIAPLLLSIALRAIPREVMRDAEEMDVSEGAPQRRTVESVSRPMR